MGIQRGVRRGCILLPVPFNLYSEDIVDKALDEDEIDIKINGVTMYYLRYANDTDILAGTHEDPQTLIDRMVTISEEYGLSLNIC